MPLAAGNYCNVIVATLLSAQYDVDCDNDNPDHNDDGADNDDGDHNDDDAEKLTLNIVAFPPWRKVSSQRVISAHLFV